MLSQQSFSFTHDDQFCPYLVLILNTPAQFLVFSIPFVQAASLEKMLKSDAEPSVSGACAEESLLSQMNLTGMAVMDLLLLFVLEGQQGCHVW